MTMCSAVFEEEYFEGERAIDVLSSQLEALGAYSREQEDHLADAWEGTHGRPLMRSYETVPEFKKRAERYVSPIAAKTYFMDPRTARENLSRLRAVIDPSQQQQNEINDLERLLDERLTVFADGKGGAMTPEASDAVAKTSRERYLRIQADEKGAKGEKRQRRPWQDRMTLAKQESDRGTLGLLITQDDHEDVRKAAERRLAQLEVTGG